MSKWREVKLGEVVDVISGYAFKSGDFKEVGDIPVIKIGNINFFDIDIYKNVSYVDKEFLNILDDKFIVREGDILISLTGSNINQPNSVVGRAGKYREKKFSVLNQRAGKIIPKDSVCKEYIYQLFSLKSMTYQIAMVAYGGANQVNISPSIIKNFKFQIPDIETQEKTADVLSAYDELIENNNRRIEILEKTAEEIYKEWFVRMRFPGHENMKFEKGIPEGWECVKLEEICNLVRGISYSTKEIEKGKGIAMLTLKSVNAFGGYNYEGLKFYNGKMADRHYLNENDLIMAITDMTQDRRVIGQVCLVPLMNYEELTFSADLILLDELKIENGYFYSLLKYGGLSKHISMFANGANVLHLNQRTLNKIGFFIASPELRELYENNYKVIQKKIENLELQNQNLIKQRDLLLPRLMNGTIEVK